MTICFQEMRWKLGKTHGRVEAHTCEGKWEGLEEVAWEGF